MRRLNSQPLENGASLDDIVTEYLRKQHAACQNPVVTCPPFSLFRPHVCPNPKGRSSAPNNMTMRCVRQAVSVYLECFTAILTVFNRHLFGCSTSHRTAAATA